MAGTSSLTATTYTTVGKVIDMANQFTDVQKVLSSGSIIGDEAVGTGDSSTTRFALANKYVVPGTDSVYLATTLSTAYTLDEDDAFINFDSAPGAVAITAAYRSIDIKPSIIVEFIERAEDKIDRKVGRTFKTQATTTQFYDGTSKGYTNVFSFSGSRFVEDSESFHPDSNSHIQERYIQVDNYPIIAVNLVGINERIDQDYNETNQDGTVAFGSATYISQGWKSDFSKRVSRFALYLKYNTGTSAAITVELQTDNSGVPSGTVLATATAIPAITNTTYQMFDALFSNPPEVIAGTQYHIVVYSSSAAASAFHWGADTSSPSYSKGAHSTSADSGSNWTADSTKDMIFNTYIVDDVATYADFRVDKDAGRIVLTEQSGLKFKKGLQNVVVNYSYGYASVPDVVEDLATKMAVVNFIETRVLSGPVSQEINKSNITVMKKEVEDALTALGAKIEARLV